MKIDELRTKPHWSYSAINTYLNVCQLQYFFRYIVQIENLPTSGDFQRERTMSLRHKPSKRQLNFDNAYNMVTSILGTAYHDLLGNTDNLKVRAYWNEMGTDDMIHEW